ncbi:hypothetical protein [Piscinibacter gummiphilus]|uniref:Uncharacterized protein n=1 Tax=Piscinibacter gummiphilus TaxID=946333 RepID=A0ABZ0D1Z3_9BURK|nr:hypothetical protein [Piscinibacter gummiphilus]WOB11206.1 hypothetical protein RXV79_26600 [Piscinibacter gummiphilus]
MNKPAAGEDAIRRRFLPMVENANLESGERPQALSAVEAAILRLETDDERSFAQDILLRSQDAFRMQLPRVKARFYWIGCLSLRVQLSSSDAGARDALEPVQASALWEALDQSIRDLKNEACAEVLHERRGGLPTWPGVILHGAVRCDAESRTWIGFHVIANMSSNEVQNFSVEGSVRDGSLFVAAAIPDASMTFQGLQDASRTIPQEGYAQQLRDHFESALEDFRLRFPGTKVQFVGGWRRMSEVVKEGEVAGADAALRLIGRAKGQTWAQEVATLKEFWPEGVDVVLGSLRTDEPVPGQAAFINLADKKTGAMVRFTMATLLAGTPLAQVAQQCVATLLEHGIDANAICLEPMKPVRRLTAMDALMPCADGVYREKEICFFGRAGWRFKRFDWDAGWNFDGPAFESDEAVRVLGQLPHPIAMERAGLQNVLIAHYEPGLLGELREQMARPGRCAGVAAGQLRLKDQRLFELQDRMEMLGHQYDDTYFVQDDAVQPPAGIYGAAHWKAASGVLFIAKRSLIDRLDETSIDKGFPLEYLRLPYPDVFVHFERPLSQKHADGRSFLITGFYASEEPGAGVLEEGATADRILVITYVYRYTGEVLRVGGLTVPLMINKDDQRDLSDVVAEHGQLLSESKEEADDESRRDANFANETLLIAAKVLLYTTLRNARLVYHKDRTTLIEQLRNLKGNKREKAQARLRSAYDSIEIGPEETDEDALFVSMQGHKIKPHWRRGVLRKQRWGKGLEFVRPVWIPPVLVNGHLVDGAPPPRMDYVIE